MENNKKTKALYIVCVATVAVIIFAIGYMIYHASRLSTDDAYIQGRVHSIASKIPGTVLKVYVNDNQSVKAGDTLVDIDPADYDLRLNEAQAALDAQKTRVADAQAGIQTAVANLQIQQVTLDQAKRDAERAAALFKDGVITREKNEKAGTALALAQAQLDAATQQLEKAKSAKELEASLVAQKEASLAIAKRNVGYTRITSGTDGYITYKSVEAGNQIQSGQPLMAVVALDDIWIVANYKETQLKSVKPGQPVEITVDTYPGKRFTGKVDSIMAGTGAVFSLFPPENALGNYVKVVQRIPVKIVLDNGTDSRHILRIGMSCVPTIFTKDE